MIGQSKISAFFKTGPTPNKRSTEMTQDEQNITPSKKTKTEKQELTPETKSSADGTSTALSPEQKARMEQNRIKAIAKLHSKTANSKGLVVNFGETWKNALEKEFSKNYFLELTKFVEAERAKHTIYPPANQVFSWTQYCTLDSVKVVILGQDPYHGPKQAHGLCFSVQKGVKPPPSLENMYKELISDIEGFQHPGHGTLIGWAEQGVLLLNSCLTVREHQANSHKDKGWEKFTDAVISWLNKSQTELVFILWGSYAQKKGACIDQKKHCVLKGVHPSPLSAHRGFMGCKHFSKCNTYLKGKGKTPIDWTQLPPQD
ncbi:uracil-DNA glycosylase 2-like [Ylistrum balloti]|uniref:uracil-DNA glycosylase 2-like n=1 Tax=Ylistrum balloti TaxID=509963 RepID=UPI002905EE8B|nr:uracil-DNA glycosylase 2-like [Ylistrum balloti]